jgi:hypothetical protein
MLKISFQLWSPPRRREPSFWPLAMLQMWQQQSKEAVMKA